MKQLFVSAILLLMMVPFVGHAQQGPPPDYTYVIQPGYVNGADAAVRTNLNDNGAAAATNYPVGSIGAYSLNNAEVQGKMRSYLKFEELKGIPAGSTIISAHLSLYGVDQSEYYSQNNVGDNSFLIRKVVGDWNDSTVTWGNQPAVTSTNEVLVFNSILSRTQDMGNIDVTQLVRDLYNDPANNFGLALQLANEAQEASIFFSSSDNSNAELRPRLTLVLNSPCAFLTKLEFKSYVYYKGSYMIKDGYDAIVATRGGNSSYSYDASNINHGLVPDVSMSTWTYNSIPGTVRTYLEFKDLSNFLRYNNASQMRILSARLFLYGIPDPQVAPQGNCASCAENYNTLTDNSCWINRVTSPWSDNTITWNNAPLLANSYNEIPPSQSKYNWDVYSLDIMDLLTGMQNNAFSNYGFAITLKDESLNGTDNSKKRSLSFAGFDYPDRAKRPRIEMVVLMNPGPTNYFEKTLELQPPGTTGEDSKLMLQKNGGSVGYGSAGELTAADWRSGSGSGYQHVTERSLLRFNLSAMDASKFVTNATLYLNPTGYNSNMGSTGSWLNRAMGTWSEATVHWDNQPPYTEINRRWIPQHTSTNNYSANVNITAMVHDILRTNTNNGFLWRLNDERWSTGASGSAPNRWVGFASSDHGDAWRRPKLVIKYIDQCGPVYTPYSRANTNLAKGELPAAPTEAITDTKEAGIGIITASPNPFKDQLRILYYAFAAGTAYITVTNAQGVQVLPAQKQTFKSGTNSINFDGSRLSAGVYYITVQQGENKKVQKVAKSGQ